MARNARSKVSAAANTPHSTNNKKGNRIKVEAKPGNEVLAVDNPVDLMGCRTEESLAAYRTNFVVRLPKGSFEYYNTHSIAQFDWFDREAALRQMCKDPLFNVIKTPKTTELIVLARLIHILVSWSLTPRKGSHSSILHFDIFLMWCVLNGKKIDLAYVIYHHMKSAQAYQKGPLPYDTHLTLFFKSMAKSVVDNKFHVEKSDQNHILDMSNLIMIGLVFDEVTRRWVEKVLERGEGVVGDVTYEEDDELSGGEPVRILVVDSEAEGDHVESTKHGGYEHIRDGDDQGADTGGDFDWDNEVATNFRGAEGVDSVVNEQAEEDNEVKEPVEGEDCPVTPPNEKGCNESAQKNPDVGASTSQQSSALFCSFIDDLKALVEYRLDRIENFFIFVDGRVRQMNDAFTKAG
ncbi:hypothetical protein Scep_029977 [Stephania cephalantha]|uniref:Uncharacterized protein n=1 Tax=Stephania cephalantha TaxID=152367 RepID=A0AAP0HGG3_9MAGN